MPDDRSMSDGDGQLTVERGANGGLQITDPRGQSVWAKITGQDAGTNRYAWAQVNDADATFPDGEPSAGFALSGTEDVEGWPAYEITGATDVATDGSAIVRLWPSPAGSFWIFANSSGGGSGNLSWKHVVRAASTGNGTLATAYENGDTVDGVTLATGDRILLKNQTTGSENGIYTVNASGAPARAADADGSNELVGATVWVSEGTVNADTEWTCVTNATISPGSTATFWRQTYPHTFLCEVTTSSSSHTVEQKTYSGGAINDASPAVSFTSCRSTTGDSLPVGTVVNRSPLPDVSGSYWITPAGYATGTLPGLLSHSTQTIGGAKTFTHDAVFNVDAYVRRGLSVNYDGGGTAASQFVVYPDGPGDVTAFVVSPGDREVHVGPLFASATTYTLYVSGPVIAKSGYTANGAAGLTTTLDVTTPTGTKTITITGGIITAIV